jgi:hypothetical protein
VSKSMRRGIEWYVAALIIALLVIAATTSYLLLSGMPSDKLSLLAPHLDTRRLAEIKVFNNPEKLAEALAKDICT